MDGDKPKRPDRLVEDGEAVEPFQAIHTPGHTPGSISLAYGPILFVGDLINTTPFRAMVRWSNQDNEQARASRQLVAKLPVSLFCPGHGKPISKIAR